MENKLHATRRDFLRMGGAIGFAGLNLFAGMGAVPRVARAQAASLQQVRIVNTGGNSNLTLQDLLTSRGFAEAVGLEVVHVNVADGAQTTKALLEGSSDICMMAGFGPVLPAIESGSRLRVVAGANLLAPQAVFTARSEIRTVRDLEGRTVGTGAMGAALHQKMVALLRQKGIDEKKVKFVDIGSSAAVLQAVIAGRVDAGPADIDVYADQARLGVRALSDGDMWSEMPLFTNQASYASERAIAEKREILVRTLAAHAQLYRFVSSPVSKDAYVGAYLARFKSAQLAEPLSQWNFYQKYRPYALDLALSEKQVRYLQDLNLSMGLQKAVLRFDAVTDMTLARDAIKLIGTAR